MKLTQFGRDDTSWNVGAWNSGPEDDGSGNPGVILFGNAIQVWAVLQDRVVTVNEAALTFNADPRLVRQAIEESAWMFVGEHDSIQHEGE